MNYIKYVVNFAQDVHSTEYGSSCLVQLYPVEIWNTLYLSFLIIHVEQVLKL